MKKPFIALLILSVCGITLAQTEWVNIGETDTSVWDIQAGSLEESKTKAGIPIVVVVGRVSTKSTKNIDVRKWYVSIEDCDRKMGKIVTLDVDGKYRHETDVVFGAGSIGSMVAEMICGAYMQRIDERDKKGI